MSGDGSMPPLRLAAHGVHQRLRRAHTSMSTQALNSAPLRAALLDILLN